MLYSFRLLVILTVLLICALASLGQCPTITVIGPSGVTLPGDSMVFTSAVAPAIPNLEYYWRVNPGTIVGGQGTPAIRIAIDRSMQGTNVTAVVEVKGLRPECESHASEVGSVASMPIGEPIDECPQSVSKNEQRARLDSFFHELRISPRQIGIVVLKVIKKDRLDSKNPTIRLIRQHARLRGFDVSRIWFAFEHGSERRIVVWRMNPDVELPCWNCPIIKGGDIR